MKDASEVQFANVCGLSEDYSIVSRRRALTGVGAVLAMTHFATPSFSRRRDRQSETQTGRHAENKRIVTEFLGQMTSDNRTEAFRRYCLPECRFEVFHPFNTLVGVEAADGLPSTAIGEDDAVTAAAQSVIIFQGPFKRPDVSFFALELSQGGAEGFARLRGQRADELRDLL